MSEIRSCEEYVLAELESLRADNERLRADNERLRESLADALEALESMTRVIRKIGDGILAAVAR